MKTILRTYSHPVLGNSDDFSSEFDVSYNITVSEDKDNWLIGLKIDMNNPVLQRLISEGNAAYHIEVECRSTFYRWAFNTREQVQEFSIPTTRLRGKVQLDAFIVAMRPVPDYKPVDTHEDYGDRTYGIVTGEILGVGGTRTFVADTEFDPLRASANSFIKIERGPDAKGNMEIQNGQDEIIIRLPYEDYDKFQEMAGTKVVEDILHASIIFPVLVDAAWMVKKNRNEQNERLRAIMEQRNLMNEEAYIVAQKILQAPVSRALLKIHGEFGS
jgi:hypothetical protein